MELQISPLAAPFELKGSHEPELLILMMHGFTASPTEIRPLADYLFDKSEERYLIKSLLLPGHGIDGPDGYKALDSISYKDWIDYAMKEIIKYSSQVSCPVVIIGLSMGSLLTVQFLKSELGEDKKYLGGVLLSPPLVMKSILFPFVKYIKYFKKYQSKGLKSEDFFEKHNLFSYRVRSLNAVDEFRKLVKDTKPLVKNISKPLLACVAENDESVNSSKTIAFLRTNKDIEILEIPKLGHIFTVEPGSEKVFEEIDKWIAKLRQKIK